MCVRVHMHQNFIFFVRVHVCVSHNMPAYVCACARHTHVCASGILFVHAWVTIDKENLED